MIVLRCLTNSNSLYVYNKIDSVSIEYLDQLAREPHTAVMSCELDLGVREVVDRIWSELRLLRIYTKRFVSFDVACVVSTTDNRTEKA